MAERDPGNAPQTNTRIQYVAINVDRKKILSDKLNTFKKRVKGIYNVYKLENENIINKIMNIDKKEKYNYEQVNELLGNNYAKRLEFT